MFKEILPKIKDSWSRASSLFESPVIVSDQRIKHHITNNFNLMGKIVRNRETKSSVILPFKQKLDSLLDLTKCRCKIQNCEEMGCKGCVKKAHVLCDCSIEVKIPALEAFFIRNKI